MFYVKTGDNCSPDKLARLISLHGYFLDEVRVQNWEGGRQRNERDFTQRVT